MPQYFVDASGTLSNVRKTAVGGLLIDATLAKTGVMSYIRPPVSAVDKKNGYTTVRRYNPPEVLAASLDELATVPVTHRHPKKFVDVSNYRDVVAGHIVGTPTFDGTHIHATLAVQDKALIAAIERGECREVSMGYMADHDCKPGVALDGETYDEARVKIQWNHVAVVESGRAGPTVRLMLDSEEIPDLEQNDMMIKIGEVEVDVSSAQAAFDSYDAGLQAQLASATAAKDAAEKRVAELEAELESATSDAAMDAAVEKRLAAKAAETERLAKLERVKAAYPAISLDGRSQDFIDALDIRLEADKAKDPEGLGKVQSTDSAAVKVAPKPAVAKMSREQAFRAQLIEQSRKALDEKSE